MITQISSALATIGQQVGSLRSAVGSTSHGRTLSELSKRNEQFDILTREFLLDATIIVACFLIRSFESENLRVSLQDETKVLYDDDENFNDFWDDLYGEFKMGDYSYPASEILYNVDYQAYTMEQKTFIESEIGEE